MELGPMRLLPSVFDLRTTLRPIVRNLYRHHIDSEVTFVRPFSFRASSFEGRALSITSVSAAHLLTTLVVNFLKRQSSTSPKEEIWKTIMINAHETCGLSKKKKKQSVVKNETLNFFPEPQSNGSPTFLAPARERMPNTCVNRLSPPFLQTSATSLATCATRLLALHPKINKWGALTGRTSPSCHIHSNSCSFLPH